MSTSRRIAAVAVVGAALVCALLWRCHGVRDSAKQPTTTTTTDTVGHRATRTFATTASISGVVTDEKRAPVPNAIVCADASSDTLHAELIREPRCTRTDSRGAYQLRDLYAARYEVAAVISPYRPERAEPFLLAERESKVGVDFQLKHEGVEVTGVVVDITGGPIARARVRQAMEPAVETDAQGRFSLWTRPGGIELHASADGYTTRATLVTLGSPRRYAPGHYEIVLVPESSISGVVVDGRTGKPVANVMVEADGDSDDVISSSDITGDDGRFRVAHLLPARYTLTARSEAAYGLSNGSVLAGLAQDVDGVVVELHPAFRVSGRVVQPDGTPCAEAEVSLEREHHWFGAHRDPDGTMRLDGVLPGTYQVNTDCPGFIAPEVNVPVVVVDRDVTNLTWPVHEAAELSGRITTRSGAPIEGAWIFAITDASSSDEKTDRDGIYRLRGIMPGEVKISIFSAEGLSSEEGYQLELGAGQRMTRDFVLTPPGRIRGVVTVTEGGPLSGIQLDVIHEHVDVGQRIQAVVTTDDTGAFEAVGLPAGSYIVRYSSNMFGDSAAEQRARVEVRAGATANVQIAITKHHGTIRGRVVDAAGKPIADAFVSAVHEGRNEKLAAILTRVDRDVRRVVTDLDGNFLLRNIGPGTYTVRAARKGSGEVLARNVTAGSSTLLRIPLTGTIEGIVKVASGAPPSELVIRASSDDVARTERFFRTGGRFTIRDLPPGDYAVKADIGRAQKELKITLAEGAHERDVTFTFADAVKLTGRIVKDNGAPVANVVVRASSAELADTVDAVSGSDGRWTIADVPRGEVELFAFENDGDLEVRNRYAVNGNGTVDLGDIVVVRSR